MNPRWRDYLFWEWVALVAGTTRSQDVVATFWWRHP
jgi:hypothetical protein